MTTLSYSHINTVDVINDIITKRPSKIIFLGQSEWEFTGVTKELIDTVKEYNVDLKIIHGCFRSQHHIDHYNSVGLSLDNVIFWGTFFFNYVYMHLSANRINNPDTYIPRDYKHKFISLNNRSHIHRCAFIDEMSKQNLLDRGIVSWIAHLNENSDYSYQYFDGKQRHLNDNFKETLDSYTLPIEWHESLFEIVTESTPHIQFITEKTVRNILLKKPFIILGARYIHRTLDMLGFKRFDEVIDYSFDDVEDLNERTELFVNNIHNILKYDSKELYELLYPKLVHNYYRAMTIITDKSLVPDCIKEHIPDIISCFDQVNFKKTLYLSVWDAHNNKEYYNNIVNGDFQLTDFESVVINQSVEHAYDRLIDNNDVNKLIAKCKRDNADITLITSTRQYNVDKITEYYDKLNSIDIPCYWISKAFQEATVSETIQENNKNKGMDIYSSNVNVKVDHLYITMNNLSHRHRCMMMDILAKNELIDLGAIAWRDMDRQYDNDRNEIPDSQRFGYPYNHWTPVRMFLDIPGVESYIPQSNIPAQYNNSFVQLVAESTVDEFFLTEKTAVPLLYNKMFLVVGSKNFHKNLVDMGFKLYDNIFDYSFDSLDSTEERIEGVVANINKYRSHTYNELEQLIIANEHVIRHNKQVALDYVFNVVPKSLEQIVPKLSGQMLGERLETVYDLKELKNATL